MNRPVCRGFALAALTLAVAACATGAGADPDGAIASGFDAGLDVAKVVMPDAREAAVTHDAGAHDSGTAPSVDATMPVPDATTSTDSGTPDAVAPVDSPVSSPDTGTDAGVDAGSPVPTTCAEANNAIGCCANNTNYYCASSGQPLTHKACGSGKVCTWNSSDGFYACETGTTPKASPSASDPIDCK